MSKNWFYKLSTYIMIIICVWLFIDLLGRSYSYTENYAVKSASIALFVIVFLLIYKLIKKWVPNLTHSNFFENDKKYVIVIVCITIFIRFIPILLLNIEPFSDFNTYHTLAKLLANNQIGYNEYIQTFPHIFGYPFVLSFFYRIFGEYLIVGQVLNVFLSAGSVLLTYLITNKLFNKTTAKLALLLSALWPSQILYVTIISTEALFNFLFLLAIYLFLCVINKKQRITKLLIDFSMVGIVIALTSSVRPLGIVIILAFTLYYVLIFKNEGAKKSLLKSLYIIPMIIMYLLSTKLINMGISRTIDLKVSTNSSAHSLLFGTNSDSRGIWNEEDSKYYAKLKQEYGTDELATKIATQEAINRVISDPLGFVDIVFYKISITWGDDAYGGFWNKSSLEANGTVSYLSSTILNTFIIISTIYYYIILLFCIIASLDLKKRPYVCQIIFPIIIFLGLFAIQILVEAQSRYHYPALPLFAIIGAYGIYVITNKNKEISDGF